MPITGTRHATTKKVVQELQKQGEVGSDNGGSDASTIDVVHDGGNTDSERLQSEAVYAADDAADVDVSGIGRQDLEKHVEYEELLHEPKPNPPTLLAGNTTIKPDGLTPGHCDIRQRLEKKMIGDVVNKNIFEHVKFIVNDEEMAFGSSLQRTVCYLMNLDDQMTQRAFWLKNKDDIRRKLRKKKNNVTNAVCIKLYGMLWGLGTC